MWEALIVECDSCGTRFQLADERVPRTGIRVRCSHCKKAFFLSHPSTSAAEAAGEVARTTASGGSTAPETTQDLAEEEEDWQFSQDLPEDSSGDLSDDDLSGDDLSGDDLSDDDLSGDLSDSDWDDRGDSSLASAEDRDHSSFGSVADMDSSADLRAEEHQASLADHDRDDFGQSGSDLSSVDFRSRSDAASSSGPSDAAPGSEPLRQVLPAEPGEALRHVLPADPGAAESDDWNFFSGETPEPSRAPAATRHVIGRLRQRAPRAPVDPMLDTHRLDLADETTLAKRVGRWLGWLLTGVLFAAGLARGVWTESALPSPGPAAVELGRLSAEAVEGRWVETLRLGWVYTVSGRLVNRTAQSVSTGEVVQVALLDASGARLDYQPAPAGPALALDALRVSSASALLAWRSKAAPALASKRLPPGGSVDFFTFLPDVPPEAASFELENMPLAGKVAREVRGSGGRLASREP